MRPMHVITAIANPLRWESRIKLYRDFEQHMLDSGVSLTTVECAFGERPHELGGNPNVNHVPVRARTVMFSKENLINIGIARLPEDWRYVSWIDADITFLQRDWANEIVHALQHYDFIQPWSDSYDLGPNGEHIAHQRSFCRLWQDRETIHQGSAITKSYARFGHPGYAWSATRQALEWVGGLIETAALGSGDHHMALGLIGKAQDSIHGKVTEGYKRPILAWQGRALRHIAKNIGALPGRIEHHWHGSKKRRFYNDRWDVLVKHSFDPTTDLKRNMQGVLELAGNKPEMSRDIFDYFRSRAEDSNGLD